MVGANGRPARRRGRHGSHGRSSIRLGPVLILAVLAGSLPRSGRCDEAAPQTGSIRGVVYDKDLGAPLQGVRVSALGTILAATTGTDGAFLLERVPAGTYTLSFMKEGYERQMVPSVAAVGRQMTDLRVDLSQEVIDMDEMVVTGGELLGNTELGLLDIRAASAAIQDSISSELMSKAGVSNVASALKLVVGTSVAEGKYATVRGLSDRYTGATLNGIRVPSADPRRRAAQVDMFPTGTIDSVSVTKTFTPDLQGDFTGGGVDIKTKAIPDGPIFAFNAAVEYNTTATGNPNFLTYNGGGLPAFGFHGADRSLPAGADDPLPTYPTFNAHPSPENIQAAKTYDHLVRSFAPAMGVTPSPAPPNSSLSLVGGDQFHFGENGIFGFMASFYYGHTYTFFENGENNTAIVSGPDQPLGISKQRTEDLATQELLMGLLASFMVQPNPDHEVALTLVGNQSAIDEARLLTEDSAYPSIERNQALHYTERSVGSAQLRGHDTFRNLFKSGSEGFQDLLLDWTIAGNKTEQDEPDVRFFRNIFDVSTLSGSMASNSTDAQNTRRIFRDITESDLQGGINLTFPFGQGTWGNGMIKAGGFWDQSDRDATQRSFTYHFSTQYGSIFNEKVQENLALSRFQATHPEQLWTDIFTDPNRIGLAGNDPPAPNQLLWTILPLGSDVDYTGSQSIDAWYAMVGVQLTSKFRFTGGLRQETTDLSVVPTNANFGVVEIIEVLPSGDRAIITVPEERAVASIQDVSSLPAASLSYEIEPGMTLRASWGKTLARPTLRELAPVATEEFIFGDEFVGNPELTLSKITNYDLRWEWLTGSGDVLSASAFYKTLVDPIELISFGAGNRTFVQPVNYPSGEVYGLELEARGSLGHIAHALKFFNVGANYASITSSVDVPLSEQESLASYGLATPTTRLQGQPDYVFNASLVYDNPRTGTSGGIFYNLIGPTLLTGAARGLEDGTPDVFEEPIGTLDMTFSQRIGKNFYVGLKAKNVLTPERRSVYVTPDGQEATKTARQSAAVYALTGGLKW